MSEQASLKTGDEFGNPFAVPARGFFEGGDRRTHLDQLRHLSQWSRRVLLVTGPRGAGKTTLYRRLSAGLEPRAKAARISAGHGGAPREVLSALVHGFGLAAPTDPDPSVLIDIVAEHALAQEASERFCVALVDDADQLEPLALEQLLGLTRRSPLRLVLFGDVRLVPAVERPAGAAGVEWHEIRLTGFGPREARAYLEWRFQDAGSSARMPFSDVQIREITRLSEGLPGRIDQMANVLLAKVWAGDLPSAGGRFPVLHKGLLTALVVVLGGAYLLWQPGGNTPDGRPGAPSDSARLAEAEPLKVPAVGEPRPPPQASPAPVPGPTRTLWPAPVAEAPASVVAPAADPPGDAPQPVSTVAPRTAAEPANQPKGRDWVRRQPPSAYTLQLVSLSSAERAGAYLAAQADPANFARLELRRNGATLHVVLFGSFASRPEAERAAGRLPESVGRVEPWIRTFGQVQAALNAAS